MSKHEERERATQFYSFLLKFYPQGYRHTFGSEMLQTFNDYYRDIAEFDEHGRAGFWFDVVTDEVKGIVREHLLSSKGRKFMKEAWVKQSLVFGIILGMIQIVNSTINNLAPANGVLTNFLNISFPVVVIIFTCIAAYYTAHKMGDMKAGLYAALLTGMVGIAIDLGAIFVMDSAFIDIARHNAGMIYDFHRSGLTSMDQFILQDDIGAAFVGTIFSLLVGGMFGTIGGYLGVQVKSGKL